MERLGQGGNFPEKVVGQSTYRGRPLFIIRSFTSSKDEWNLRQFEISRVVFMPNITYKSCYYLFIDFIAELSRARSARSGAPWVRKFGNLCIRTYVRPPLHVSRGEILHFKYPRVSAVNPTATRPFRDKKQQQWSRIFHSTQFNVYIGVDIRERARARDKKQKRPSLFEE